MSEFFADEDEVKKTLNIAERALGGLDASDDYLAALLQNQKLLAQGLLDSGVFANKNDIGINNIDRSSLPIGLTGTSTEEIEREDTGIAIFDVAGGTVEARVRANGKIERNEPVVVMDEDNEVRSSQGVGETLNVRVKGRQGSEDSGYYATEQPVAVDSFQEETIEWDFLAEEVAVFGYDKPIYIAFNDPENSNRLIPLNPKEESFSMGISTRKLWYRLPSPNADPTSIKVVAKKNA